MSFVSDFKAFIMRGNVVDLAVGVIIGGAFGAIVSSLVNDVIMPPIGYMMSGVDFKSLYYALDGKHYDSLDAAKKAGVALTYGNFINSTINFLIIAFVIFLLVQAIAKLYPPPKPVDAPAPGPSPDVVLLTEIRDLLAKK
jgi:large conductance mechanosensitive channel